MNNPKYAALAALGLAVMLPLTAYAASDAIMDDRESECAIWLCLPGGFPEGCEAAKRSYVKRITSFTGGHHPRRKFTDLPRFDLCVDENPPGIEDYNVGPDSVITWQGAYEVHMPAYNVCTRWGYRGAQDNQVRYCAAVKTVPARTFESQEKYHEYSTIEVGWREAETHYAPTVHYTDVLVDGVKVGQRYYDNQ